MIKKGEVLHVDLVHKWSYKIYIYILMGGDVRGQFSHAEYAYTQVHVYLVDRNVVGDVVWKTCPLFPL